MYESQPPLSSANPPQVPPPTYQAVPAAPVVPATIRPVAPAAMPPARQPVEDPHALRRKIWRMVKIVAVVIGIPTFCIYAWFLWFQPVATPSIYFGVELPSPLPVNNSL